MSNGKNIGPGNSLDAEQNFLVEEELMEELVESGGTEGSSTTNLASKNLIIVRSEADENPKMGQYVLKSGHVIRVPNSGTPTRTSAGGKGSPLKVQVIGGQGMRRTPPAQIPVVQRISSGPAGHFKPIVSSGSPGGAILVKGQNPNAQPARQTPTAAGNVSKVQYYRVMQAGDSKNVVQAASFRPLVSESSSPSGAQLKSLAPTSYGLAPANESQVYSFPRVVPASQSGDSLNTSKRKSVVSGLKKPCNCTKSMCLKLYCDCFANGEFCRNCNCKECHNNLVHDGERTKAIKSCLDRNPNAFQPKIGKGKGRSEVDRIHQKGCHCKKSSCLKNYCECYEAKVPCTPKCKCCGCRNTEHDRQSKGGSTAAKLMSGSNSGLLNLASAAATADLRPDSPLTDTSSEKPDPKSMPWFYMTDEVVECTTLCMVAQAEEMENRGSLDEIEIEKAILKEFGRCLHQIIENATVSAGVNS